MRTTLLLLITATGLTGQATWEAHFTAGAAYEKAGRFDQAATEFEAAQAEGSDLQRAVAQNNLGVVYRALGRTHESERCYRAALTFYESRPELAASLATTLQNLAALDLESGQVSKAEALYRRSYDIRIANLPLTHPAIALSLQGLARVEQERNHTDRAESYYRRALAIHESAPAMHNLATLLDEHGRLNEARPLFERALASYRAETPGHPDVAIVLRHLAELDEKTGDCARADAEFREAVAICERTLSANSRQTGVILQSYAHFLKQTKRTKEAAAVSVKATAIMTNSMRETGEAWRIDAALLARN